jgi:hypothetical protein
MRKPNYKPEQEDKSKTKKPEKWKPVSKNIASGSFVLDKAFQVFLNKKK